MLVKFHRATDRSKFIVINSDAVAYVTEHSDMRTQCRVSLRDVNQVGVRDSFDVSGTLDQVMEAFHSGETPA
jgi:hypothetical protein